MQPCDPSSTFFGFLGVTSALVFANMGAAYGTAKSGRSQLLMREHSHSSPDVLYTFLILTVQTRKDSWCWDPQKYGPRASTESHLDPQVLPVKTQHISFLPAEDPPSRNAPTRPEHRAGPFRCWHLLFGRHATGHPVAVGVWM